MKQLESGGCCLARQGGVATFPSKAERIMARFRPIAPKPTPHSSSNCRLAMEIPAASVSANSFAIKPGTDTVKTKRLRKRRVDSDARTSKRSNFSKLDLLRCSINNPIDASVCRSTTPGDTRFQIGIGDGGELGRVAPGLVPGSLRAGDTCVDATRNAARELPQVSDVSPVMILGGRVESCSCRKSEGAAAQKVISDLMDSSGRSKRDDAFMDRAAASAAPIVLPESRNDANSKKDAYYAGGFREMIRGLTSRRSAPALHSFSRSNETEEKRECMVNVDAKEMISISIPQHHDNNGAAITASEAGDDTKLITLPLLPDTPSHADFFQGLPFSACSVVTTKADMASVSGLQAVDLGDRSSIFSLFGDELGIPPAHGLSSLTNYQEPSVLDREYVEKVHGKSPDPVLLVDDSHQVLWFNRAYAKAVTSIVERGSCTTADGWPCIDPLGIPTVLGSFSLQPSPKPGTASIVTLWRFLKKLVVQEDDALKEQTDILTLSALLKHSRESHLAPVKSLSLSGREQKKKTSLDREEAKKHGVIMPQPKRLVGSTVSLQSVTEVHSHTHPLSDSLEIIEAQLEESSMPAFISSWSNRVRWVNTAYKQMVGQPECPWLASTVTTSSSSISRSSKVDGPSPTAQQSPRPNGQVSLICTSGKIPGSAAAFSGRVNIQWTNMGERSSMTVPCDVARLAGCSGWWMLVWKFDVAASLRLNCG
eukprot:c23778_g1_i2 orf=275-2401(-)